MSSSCIGIDFGTGSTKVAITKDNIATVVANADGYFVTPSYVSFTETEILTGNTAKNQARRNLPGTIFQLKAFVGKTFEEVKDLVKDLPFQASAAKDGSTQVNVTIQGKDKVLAIEELISYLLKQIKSIAESSLGTTVSDCVINLPVGFSPAQKDSLIKAGSLAGLTVRRIINDANAAALAYGYDKNISPRPYTLLIYDLGAHTLSVTVLEVLNGLLEIKATISDGTFGGQSFDELLVHSCAQEFCGKFRKDLSLFKASSSALVKLRASCESAKIRLSNAGQASIEIDSLFEGIDYNTHISRAKFENMGFDLFKKCIAALDQLFSESKIDKSTIDEILLVGGGTNVPKLQADIANYFPNKKINKFVNPEQAVALGCALQGAVLAARRFPELEALSVIDATSLTLSIGLPDGKLFPIAIKGSAVPFKKKLVFTTNQDSQNSIFFPIYEGEHPTAEKNHLLCRFVVTGIKSEKKGIPKILVTFHVDTNGVLNLTAVDETTGHRTALTVVNEKGRISLDDVNNYVI